MSPIQPYWRTVQGGAEASIFFSYWEINELIQNQMELEIEELERRTASAWTKNNNKNNTNSLIIAAVFSWKSCFNMHLLPARH